MKGSIVLEYYVDGGYNFWRVFSKWRYPGSDFLSFRYVIHNNVTIVEISRQIGQMVVLSAMPLTEALDDWLINHHEGDSGATN